MKPCVVSLRLGGAGLLSTSGRPSGSSHFTLWGKFSGVPQQPDPDRLPHRHLLWHLCVGGGHHGQLLPGLRRSLLPAPQQRQQGWGRGRERLSRREKVLHTKCFTQDSSGGPENTGGTTGRSQRWLVWRDAHRPSLKTPNSALPWREDGFGNYQDKSVRRSAECSLNVGNSVLCV